MAQFIVHEESFTPDGSDYEKNPVFIHAPDIEKAKEDGAALLGVSVTKVVAEPYAPVWD